MATGYLYHPDCLLHRADPFHPERPARLQTIDQARIVEMERDPHSPLHNLIFFIPEPADIDWIASVHHPDYVRSVEIWCQRGYTQLPTGDTPLSRDSYQAALCAVGAGLASVDALMDGRVRNAFCAVRPPGHHAEFRRGMGFCIFNTVAVMARYAQKKYGMERVAIIDWDVHHGNGTQAIFEEDPSVFYMSLHQSPLYPYTGLAWENGTGAGEGYTLNIPLKAGAGDQEFIEAFREKIVPTTRAYRPDLVLLSSGFDAHQADLLSGTMATEKSFDAMLDMTMELAEETCTGRLISTLEGGYNLKALSSCVLNHLRRLAAL